MNIVKGSIKEQKPELSVEKEKIIENNKNVFNEIGSFPDKVTIKINKDAVPKICPDRRIPYAIKEKLKVILNELVEMNIIEEVNEPSEWVSNIVIVEKQDKSLRLCLDPCELNKYIVREIYQIPTKDEIKLALSGKKWFSVLDIKNGFYYMELDKETNKLFAFSTPYGVFRFLRMPFGCTQQHLSFFKS